MKKSEKAPAVREDTSEEKAVRLLKQNGFTVTAAESCTGGLLSGRLVDVPGVSEVFKAGFVTYSDKAKRKYLKVKKKTLKKYGAVSRETAMEMAKGAAAEAKADAALSVTGIAGPDGGTEEKPVGLVYIGCYLKKRILVEEHKFSGDRAEVRKQSVDRALNMLIEMMSDLDKNGEK
jgi:PncC family amidohydrolase